MSPNYSHITSFFEENVVFRKPKSVRNTAQWYKMYKNELEKDPVFLKIKNAVGISNIFYKNLESFSHPDYKTKFRLRSDLFLKTALKHKLDKTFVLFSCVRINGIKTYIVLTSNYFSKYPNKTSSSNSFLTKEFDELKKWSTEEGGYVLNERKTKRSNVVTYIFWHGNENNLQSLDTYLNILSIIPREGYAYVRKAQPGDPAIPKTTADLIRKIYNYECAFKLPHSCLTQNSFNNDISKEIHHIVTREFFRDQKITNSKIVNNKNNLVLLCFKCHDKLSSKNKFVRKKYLSELLDILKQRDLYVDFEKYLLNDVKITIPLLYKMYGVSYD